VWDRELRREADWRVLGGWRPRHVERGGLEREAGRGGGGRVRTVLPKWP
jgi:hypothetical protein